MCWYCAKPILDAEPIGRSLTCTGCGKDLRVCRNCRRYASGGCGESEAIRGGEVPADPERANFCGWFSLDPKFRSQTQGADTGAAEKAKDAFSQLFSDN